MGSLTGTIKALAKEIRNPSAVMPTARSVVQARQEPQPPERADELADIAVRDHEGQEVRLGDFWRDGPAVLVFLRHWG